MSRSYKKTPRAGDSKNKVEKKLANHRFRQNKLTRDLNYGSYKKNHNSWNICDFEDVGTTFELYWSFVVSHWLRYDYSSKPYPNKDKVYKEWYLLYKRK